MSSKRQPLPRASLPRAPLPRAQAVNALSASQRVGLRLRVAWWFAVGLCLYILHLATITALLLRLAIDWLVTWPIDSGFRPTESSDKARHSTNEPWRF